MFTNEEIVLSLSALVRIGISKGIYSENDLILYKNIMIDYYAQEDMNREEL